MMRGLKAVAAIAGAIVVLGAAGFGVTKYIHAKQEAERRAPILALLIDPASAMFRGETHAPGTLCGEVNSKNSMGGYTGFKRFVTQGARFAIEKNALSAWPEHETELLVAGLDAKIAVLRSAVERGTGQPADQEIEDAITTAQFALLWNQVCAH